MNPKISVAFDRTLGPAFYRAHVWVYRKSHGRLLTKAMGLPMVLLTTSGRTSGLARTVALLSYPASESRYVVVASNGGRANPPAWLGNIDANPQVTVQVGSTQHQATARRATAEEKAQLFPSMTAKYSGWAHYETLTDRVIPIVLIDI